MASQNFLPARSLKRSFESIATPRCFTLVFHGISPCNIILDGYNQVLTALLSHRQLSPYLRQRQVLVFSCPSLIVSSLLPRARAGFPEWLLTVSLAYWVKVCWLAVRAETGKVLGNCEGFRPAGVAFVLVAKTTLASRLLSCFILLWAGQPFQLYHSCSKKGARQLQQDSPLSDDKVITLNTSWW